MNRRLVLKAKGRPMVIESKHIPHPPPNGMVIKVRFVGVCHDDAHTFQQTLTSTSLYPKVLGHEVGGIVHSVGDGKIEGAAHFKKGERVVLYPWGGCRKCKVCKLGSQHCMARDEPDSLQYGTIQEGGFQEYIVVHDRRLVLRVPESLALDVACLLPCSALTAYNAICQLEEAIALGEKERTPNKAVVLIAGAGGVGQWAVRLIKAVCPTPPTVCVVDVADDKLLKAKELGADLTLNWEAGRGSADEVAVRLRRLCGGPVDAAIDFVGIPSSFHKLQLSLKYNGTLLLVGLLGGLLPAIDIPLVVLRNLNIQGVYGGSKAQLEDLLAIICRKKIDPPSISYVVLDDVNTVIDNLIKGRQKGKAVVKFH